MLLYKDIIKDDNLILREKSEPVSLPLQQEDIEIIEKINEYLINGYNDEIIKQYDIRPAYGLAAPQIGVLKKMFVLLATDEKGKVHHYGVINPKIISHSEEKAFLPQGEGCLSVDRDVEGLIHRHKRIKTVVQLFNFDTKTVKEEQLKLEGLVAVIFQHEYDHLFGILFYDYIDREKPFYIPENSYSVHIEQKNEAK
ncbi:MAG: peptide deformylase [Bacilli bacterium]|nr:peptide deformylase [Bacilli bacterium]MDD4076561.1 peptide deformylase [Bacilli bacterium]MDD4387912.1 peptide deformylase [Bacilli bacterium]